MENLFNSMSSFIQTLYPTPYGFYDSDPGFQKDADSVVVYVKRKLGEDILSAELTKKEIWGSFEEATRLLNSWVVEYQTKSNLASLLGTATGSYNATTNQNTINLTNTYVAPNLEFLDKLAEPYANIIGYGATQNSFSGSINLEIGRQDYDLYTELQDEFGIPLYSMLSGSGGKMRVFEVFHYAPIQYLFNSSFGSNFSANGGIGIPMGAFNSDTRFSMLPIYEDVLRASMLQTAKNVRRSHYNYKISGRNIRIFPAPSSIIEGINNKVWIRVGFASQATGAFIDLGVSGSISSSVASGFSGQAFGASNPANVPMGLINYSMLNQWAKTWIARMTFALSTEITGRIRRKVSRIPIPGAEVELDGAALVTEAREDQKILLEELKVKLENLSYDKLQEMETTKAENMLKQQALIPIPPGSHIRRF